jgi:hypothetical protein
MRRCAVRFAIKTQDVVAKLISSPSDYPRSYICDECIAVCNSILEDDRAEANGESGSITLSIRPQQQAGLRALAQMEGLSPDALIGEVVGLDARACSDRAFCLRAGRRRRSGGGHAGFSAPLD